MKLFNKVAIIGTGLIGGSMGLAMKRKGLVVRIIGLSRHRETLSQAKRIHAIDEGAQDINAIRDADLVIFATPVNTILKMAPLVSRIVNKNCIISDVGSTKEKIAAQLSRQFPNYVGTHPLAGSEKRSIAYASPMLFKNSLCIITPIAKTDKLALDRIVKLWRQMGARVVFLSPKAHDRILSMASHLPHVSSFSLMNTLPRNYLKFSGGGLKDATRIAASDAQLWADIFLSNRKNITEAINLFQANLSKIKLAIRQGNRKELFLLLKKAKQKREILNSLR